MKNKKQRPMFVFLLILLPIIAIVFIIMSDRLDPQRKLQNENSNAFINSINSLEDGKEYRLSDIIPFKWDQIYVFPEYTDESHIEKVIGFESSRVRMSDSEAMQQIIFVKNRKIVCYVQDMDYRLGFSIERKNQDYLSIENDDKHKLHVNLRDSLRYLEFKPIAQ
ncbi:hypothetical protein ACFRAM_23245 [Paenibacillus sp. NPDC056722]|uniref:hypothetical protein n=1 Tax=Paenibacillus sp. NPDC056722 TaxID=3345924 RepID=UPI0036CF52C5